MNRKVGRAVLCAPTAATTFSCNANNGAHGVTRPTSARRFMAPMRVQVMEISIVPVVDDQQLFEALKRAGK